MCCRVADLARLYVLCARIQELEPLRVAFREYIGRTGLALVLDEEKVPTLSLGGGGAARTKGQCG